MLRATIGAALVTLSPAEFKAVLCLQLKPGTKHFTSVLLVLQPFGLSVYIISILGENTYLLLCDHSV